MAREVLARRLQTTRLSDLGVFSRLEQSAQELPVDDVSGDDSHEAAAQLGTARHLDRCVTTGGSHHMPGPTAAVFDEYFQLAAAKDGEVTYLPLPLERL